MGVIPPKFMQENARKALDALGDGFEAMTRTGRIRARQLADGKNLSVKTLRRISNFRRHESNASYSGNWKKDKGMICSLG